MDRIAVLFLSAAFLFACKESDDQVGSTEIATWQYGKSAAISITYDDATINQFRKALPIMDTLGFSGTFFINTADIPGSQFTPKYSGRPLAEIVKESARQKTNRENLFERASAVRFLNIDGAIEAHNSAGSLYEQEKFEEAFKAIDDALERARKLKSVKEVRPVLLKGEVITWGEIKEFASRGHEFGNHTISHPRLAVLDEQNLLYEIEKCKEEIINQLGVKHSFSLECPFGTEDERVMQYAYKIHPALRNRMPEPYLEELNRWNQTNPGASDKPYVQWQRGPLQRNGLDEMKSWVDTVLRHDNVWLVLTFHGVDGIGWEAKPSQQLKEYFTYMKQHEDSLWVATFGDATKYIREKMNADLKSENKSEGIAVSLNHSLDKEVYDLPLTLKTYVDEDWENISVSQGSKVLAAKRGTDAKGTFVLYQAIPNSDDIAITED